MTAALRRVTEGEPGKPLALLFALNLVDEFDRAAFAGLTPEIRDAFGLGDTEIAAIGTFTAAAIVLAAYPIGRLSDALPRVRVALAAAALWGAMTVTTGLAGAVVVLAAARLLAGIGRVANEVVHPSLLTDYYPATALPGVFQVHRAANPLGSAAAVVAGAVAALASWRHAFLVLAVPTALLLVPLARLPEPRRRSPRPDAPERSGGGGFGTLWGIPTFRRFFLTAFLLGAVWLPLPQFLSLFFEEVHDAGAVLRGTVQAAYGAGIVAGLAVGGPFARRAMAERTYRRATAICASGIALIGAGFVALAAAPMAALAVAVVAPLAAGFGLFQPAYFTLVGQVAPVQSTSRAFATSLVFFSLGGASGVAGVALAGTLGYPGVALGFAAVALAGAAAAASTGPLVEEELGAA